MKRLRFATVLMILAIGCDTHREPQSASSTSLSSNASSSSSSSPAETFEFYLSDSAKAKVGPLLESTPDGTCLVVFVDVDDELYCTGFHYNLSIESEVSTSRFLMTEDAGIKIAIEKDDLRFLDGTTLDFYSQGEGAEGFVFKNPNEKTAPPAG